MSLLSQTLNQIKPLDKAAVSAAKQRLDNLIKPIGSLGRLEEIAWRWAGITGNIKNKSVKKSIVIMCADNGLYEEGFCAAGQEVTAQQTANFSRGICGVSVLARQTGAALTVVDIGIKTQVDSREVIVKKLMNGTNNIRKGPAMTRLCAIRSIEAGIEITDMLAADGVDMIGVGEMGIGNTTTSAAVLSVLTGSSVEAVTGRGAGADNMQLEQKKRTIKDAIALNQPVSEDVVDVLSKVGGLDICGMCGVFLGAAKHRIPVLIDGFISAVAALCAYELNSDAVNFMFPSHGSYEIGMKTAMERLGLKPMLDLDMRLGEGSGCALGMQIMDAAAALMNDMATFQEAMVTKEGLEGKWPQN